MSIPPRIEIERLAPAIHGGLDHAELARLGLEPDQIIDFSASINPWGPPPQVGVALAKSAIERYPDAQTLALRRRLAERNSVSSKEIIVSNGTIQLIWLLALTYLWPDDEVLILEPTFGEYRVASQLMGAGVVTYRAQSENGFRSDIEEILTLICKGHPRLIFLCNPNNPTGVYLDRSAVEAILRACHESLLVIDEAYRSFVAQTWPPFDPSANEHLVVLRSMTKDYALAGLRLGYAIAHRDIIAALGKVQPPWSVNAAAQAAGLAALANEDWLQDTLSKTAKAKDYLIRRLSELGLKVQPSTTNFLLVKVGNGRTLRAWLLRRGLLVRDCASFGLPEYMRISVRRPQRCRRLIAALREWLSTAEMSKGAAKQPDHKQGS